MTEAFGPQPLAYRSAIALKLAAKSPPVSPIARGLANGWASRDPVDHAPCAWEAAIAGQCRLTVEASGWLQMELADAAIAAWLQTVRQTPLPLPVTAPPPPLPRLPHLPLCDQWQVSLPLLLQWGHARCQTWWRYLAASPDSAAPPPLWSGQCPLAAYQLLHTVINAVDRIAAQTGDRRTHLRQGYAIVAALNTYQARLPLQTMISLAPPVRSSLITLLGATQQVLAWCSVVTLHQAPWLTF